MGSSGFSKRDKNLKKHVFRRVKKSSSRKERRKIERAAKKRKNAAYFSRKKGPALLGTGDTVELQQKKLKKAQKEVVQAASQPNEVLDKHTKKQHLELADVSRKSALLAANSKEDKEIAKLEKLLKMKKRKNLPTSFSKEGLDCILSLKTNTQKTTLYSVS